MRSILFSLSLTILSVLTIVTAEKTDLPTGFVDVTLKAGIDYRHTNRSFENPYAHIMEGYTALGASAAVADFDGDGFEDLFVTDSKEDGVNRLYRNNGDFTFTDVAEKAGIADGNDSENASSDALWFDLDNDGDPDLLVVRFGQNQLFENRGDGTFRDISQSAGITHHMNAITSVAFDYDLDGDLDLFVGGYFQKVNVFDPETPRFFPESFETADNGGGMVLFQNAGDRTFKNVTLAAGFDINGWTLDLGHADADGDGDDDLYVACDFGTDRFFENKGDGTFKDLTEDSIGIDTKKGMNVDWGDFDNDGLLDIYVTNITDEYMREGNFLWRNNGDLTFSDVSRETDTFDTGWGWAGKFFDYDHDGWLDLYVVNGWVSGSEDNYVLDIFEMVVQPDIDFADARNWPPMGNKTLSGYQRSKLFHNEQGELFTDRAPAFGIDSEKDGRGIAVADFDNDGKMDLFVSNANSEPLLFRNQLADGPDRNWVQFMLEGTKSNRDAVGTQIHIGTGKNKRLSYVNGGNGFASQSTRRIHFGLAGKTVIDQIEVRWPSGLIQTFKDIKANQIYQLVEGKGLDPKK